MANRKYIPVPKPKPRPAQIWTDGACQPNPGLGGWAYIILSADEVELGRSSGCVPETTSQRMEVHAVIEGLKAARDLGLSTVCVNTDSKYTILVGQGAWRRHTNRDIWARFDAINSHLIVTFRHVRGHSGVLYNELADQMADEAIAQWHQAVDEDLGLDRAFQQRLVRDT